MEYQGDGGVKEVGEKGRFQASNRSVENDAGGNENCSCNGRHSCHASNELSSGQNHATATEDIVDDIEKNKEQMDKFAVTDAHEFETRMCIAATEYISARTIDCCSRQVLRHP